MTRVGDVTARTLDPIGMLIVSIHDLFITPENKMYLLATWITPDGNGATSGVLVFDGDDTLIQVIPIPLFVRGPGSLVVDSTGAFYIRGLQFQSKHPASPLVTANTIHKFSAQGNLIASFSPLTDDFTREQVLDPHVYQALLIDARDRLYHVYSDGRKVRTYDTNGRLLNQMAVSLDDQMSPSPVNSVERRILGAFVWRDRLALSLGTTYRAADGAPVRTECYTLLIDPLTGSQTILNPAPGAYPAVTMELDGYAYAVIHSHDLHMGTASFVIAREEILTRR